VRWLKGRMVTLQYGWIDHEIRAWIKRPDKNVFDGGVKIWCLHVVYVLYMYAHTCVSERPTHVHCSQDMCDII
jgi:hypothetical protein